MAGNNVTSPFVYVSRSFPTLVLTSEVMVSAVVVPPNWMLGRFSCAIVLSFVPVVAPNGFPFCTEKELSAFGRFVVNPNTVAFNFCVTVNSVVNLPSSIIQPL